MAKSERSPATREQLFAALAGGRSLKQAAGELGVHERTARRWLAAHREQVLEAVVAKAVRAVCRRPFMLRPMFTAALAGPSRGR